MRIGRWRPRGGRPRRNPIIRPTGRLALRVPWEDGPARRRRCAWQRRYAGRAGVYAVARRRAPRELPECTAILLCERAIYNPETERNSVIEVLDRIDMPDFPSTVGPVGAYARLVGGVGGYAFRFEIHDLEAGEIAIATPENLIEFGNAGEVVTLTARLPAFEVTGPGPHDRSRSRTTGMSAASPSTWSPTGTRGETMARKTPKGPDRGETRTPDEGAPQERQPMIPKARHVGGNTYLIPVCTPTPRRPIPKKYRKAKQR